MRRYTLNKELSREIYKQYKSYMEMKMCYSNVYHIFEHNIAAFKFGSWKIAYGYVSSVRNILCRHCFILNEQDEVVDPTIFTQSEAKTDREYFAFKVFDDVVEYLDAIEKNKLYLALERVLVEEEKQAHEWAVNNGYFLVG